MTLTRQQVAARVAQELPDGGYVNLGIGLPTLVPGSLPSGVDVVFHSENGVLGVGGFPMPGDEDPDLIDAGKQTVTVLPGAAFFDSSMSFAMIRGGHLDVAVLGAFEVAVNGDFANWSPVRDPLSKEPSPDWQLPGVGGAVDLAMGAKHVFVLLRSLERNGISRLVPECRLPLTGRRCVDRVICDLGVFVPSGDSFVADELATGVDEQHVRDVFARAGVPVRFR